MAEAHVMAPKLEKRSAFLVQPCGGHATLSQNVQRQRSYKARSAETNHQYVGSFVFHGRVLTPYVLRAIQEARHRAPNNERLLVKVNIQTPRKMNPTLLIRPHTAELFAIHQHAHTTEPRP
jgi:hypothetical protein